MVFIPPQPPSPPAKPSNLVPPHMPAEIARDPKQRAIWEVPWRWFEALGRYVDKIGQTQTYNVGVAPGKHSATHWPDSPLDPLAVDASVGLGNANDEGSANSLARSDHLHKRDVRVARDGSDVGTRNRLNLSSAFTVADDSGNDEVDVGMSIDPDALLFIVVTGF